jgi:hypothetical protein
MNTMNISYTNRTRRNEKKLKIIFFLNVFFSSSIILYRLGSMMDLFFSYSARIYVHKANTNHVSAIIYLYLIA